MTRPAPSPVFTLLAMHLSIPVLLALSFRAFPAPARPLPPSENLRGSRPDGAAAAPRSRGEGVHTRPGAVRSQGGHLHRGLPREHAGRQGASHVAPGTGLTHLLPETSHPSLCLTCTHRLVLTRRLRAARQVFEGQPNTALIAGGIISGVVASVLTQPLDTVKTRMQARRPPML